MEKTTRTLLVVGMAASLAMLTGSARLAVTLFAVALLGIAVGQVFSIGLDGTKDAMVFLAVVTYVLLFGFRACGLVKLPNAVEFIDLVELHLTATFAAFIFLGAVWARIDKQGLAEWK